MTSSRAIALAVAAAVLACIAGVLAGSSGFGLASADIIASIRVPRVLAGFGAGAALAVSGALMQLLTRNALADPYVLGVAGAWRFGASGLFVGSRPDAGVVLGGYAVFDLRAVWQPRAQWQVEARLANALDRTVEPVRDYRGLGRQAWIGVRYASAGL